MPWASTAPEISGLPGGKNQEIVTFLMAGKLNGKEANPPMPGYRFSAVHARAVLAYLRSLATAAANEGKSAPTAK